MKCDKSLAVGMIPGLFCTRIQTFDKTFSKKSQKIFANTKIVCIFASETMKENNTMKQKLPIYLVEFGMQFRIKSSIFTLLDVNEKGMYEARDKFGLICEFHPNTAVYV